ncbi:MAG: hypothetical protein ACI4M0_06020 [Christensenellales bacterium]
MTSLKKQLLNSCIALAVVAACLVLSFFTFGWFASNENVSANGFSVQAHVDFGAEICVRPVTAISDNVYTFSTDVIATELPMYDKYGINVVEYEKALVLEITFFSDSPKINFSVSASGSFQSGGWENAQALSNVVSFFVVDGVSGNVATAAATEFSFASVQTVDGVETIVRESPTLTLLSNYDVVGDGTTQHLYVVVTYNVDAVEYYCARTDAEVLFENDIVFNIEKAEETV